MFEKCRMFCSIFNVGINPFKEEDTRRDTKHGYAMTVHCSQGSSINDVFVDEKDLATIKNKWLKLKLMYVAYSRAIRYIGRLI
jgi:ATP-dependent exoDNAse (exonuclease V) alpha subunit